VSAKYDILVITFKRYCVLIEQQLKLINPCIKFSNDNVYVEAGPISYVQRCLEARLH